MHKILKDFEQSARQRLLEAKERVQVFGMDYDGTLVDGEDYLLEHAIQLIEEILSCGKTPAFITARAATAIKTFVPPLQEYYKAHPNATPAYIGGGNGTVLYRLDGKGMERIYNHGLLAEEVRFIVDKWKEYAEQFLPKDELSEKGLAKFEKFYSDDWENVISAEILEIGRPYEARVLTEEAKVTFVLPRNTERHRTIVEDVQKLVGDAFIVVAGDKDFCHITKRLHEDGKKVAVMSVLNILGLNQDQAATFGDMPHGNDRGLLSFPYSFTNYSEIALQNGFCEPPYILPEEGLPPVGRVHAAIRFLIGSL